MCFQNYRIVHAYPGLIAHHELCLSLSSSSRHPGRWMRQDDKAWKVYDMPSLFRPGWHPCLRRALCSNMGGYRLWCFRRTFCGRMCFSITARQ